ncbi:MAG: response regulator [Novosphingobium sp.]|nr:MAG: response regulator [Novosphingobium sp.]
MSVIKILLVEDEKDIQLIVKIVLEKSGDFAIETFDDGISALEHLSAERDRYDLAVVNFRLPGMHGLEFIRKMQAIPAYADLPAILISAALFERDLNGYEDIGVLGLISKPFDVKGLPRQVMDLYRRRDG